MSAGWVAAVVRARSLTSRCPGRAGAREIAASPTLEDGLHRLAATPYGRYARAATTLPQAQRAVTATLLWHLRVLAGWLPRSGSRLLRPLASGFEIANVASRLPVRGDARTGPQDPALQPYRLGALETAWRSLERAATPGELRAALAASPWGDPGAETPWALITSMRMAAARRTAAIVPSARRWAQGRAALLTAREQFVHRRPLPALVRRDAQALLGPRAVDAATFADFRGRLPSTARWVLADVEEPGDLWRAEARWWRTLHQDGVTTLREARYGSRTVVAAVAVLSVDAWRVRAALESAARGGRPLEEWDALV